MRVLLLLPFLAACSGYGGSPLDNRDESRRLSELGTRSLWRIQDSTKNKLELAQVEAELGSRDAFASGSAYLGKRSLTDARAGRWKRPSQDDPSLDGVNCDDFLTNAAAQAEFLGSGGPSNDRHKLDDDGDGLACGWKEDLGRSVARARRG